MGSVDAPEVGPEAPRRFPFLPFPLCSRFSQPAYPHRRAQGKSEHFNAHTSLFKNDTLHIEDEWDTKQIAEDIVKRNPLMIRSTYAGGRKSHIAKHFSKLGY